MEAAVVLDARDLSLGYADKPAVENVSLVLCAGELVGLVGVNGAGKSTLLRGLAGLLEPRSGSVALEQRPLAGLSRTAIARRLSFTPQEYMLDLPFTVGEVVLMGRYPHGRGLPTEDDGRRAADALARCGAAHLCDRRWAELSGGERRRALLAQALCQEARVQLYDEPTAALDPAHQLAIVAELRREAHERGAAVLVAVHDLNLPARFCDRLLVLAQGRLVADGPPADVLPGQALAGALGVSLHVARLPEGGPLFVVPR